MEAYFGGTGVKAVNVPNGSKIAVLELGEETTQISLMNLKFMAADSFREYEAELEYTGKYYATNQGVGNKCTYAVTSDTNVAGGLVINLKDVNSITISGKGGNTPRLWCFLDANDIILSCAAEQASATNLKLTIPNNAVKCIVQFMSSTAYKIVINEGVKGGFKYTSLPKLEFLRIENCSQLNPFQMLKSIYNTDGNVIRDIRIIGFDVDGDASDVTMIANLANDLDKDGNPHTYNGIDADGKPIDNSHPVIEGRLSINGNIYEEDYNALKAVFANLAMEFLGFYVSFKDPEVLRVLLEKITTDDGVGLTTEDVEKVTTISGWFNGNTTIVSFDEFVNFNKVTTLGSMVDSSYQYAPFKGCSSLESITLPESVTQIGYYSFFECANLGGINLENVTKILDYGFTKTAITEINAPKLTGALGTRTFAYCTSLKDVKSLGEITSLSSNQWNYGVFYQCTGLESCVLPETLVTIGIGTFNGCTSLKSLNIPKGLLTLSSDALSGCSSLYYEELNLPNLTSLGKLGLNGPQIKRLVLPSLKNLPSAEWNSMNYGNKSILEEISIPSVTSVPANSFHSYKALTKVGIAWESLTSIGGNAFNSVPIGAEVNLESLTSIGMGAFANADVLKVLSLGQITTTPENSNWESGGYRTGLFNKNVNLTFVRLPASLTKLGSAEFAGCTNLETLICESVEPPTMSTGATLKSTKIASGEGVIVVPAASMSAYAEASNWSAYASRLAPLEDHEDGGYVPFADKAVEAICVANWDTNKSGYMSKNECAAVTSLGTVFNGNTEIVSFDELQYFTNITILSGTTDASGAFRGCTNLQSIVIPESVKKLQNFTFYNCSMLSHANLENIESIGPSCFYASGITKAIIPCAKTIDNQGFYQCPNLKVAVMRDIVTIANRGFRESPLETVVINNVTPPTIAANTFIGSSCPIYVPDVNVETYKSASNWIDYASRIKGISELATDNPTLYAEIEEYL